MELGICFLIIIVIINLIIYIRNNTVYNFRIYVLGLSSEYERQQIYANPNYHYNGHTHFDKLPEYNSMIFSFKRIKLHNYFKKEEMDELYKIEIHKRGIWKKWE